MNYEHKIIAANSEERSCDHGVIVAESSWDGFCVLDILNISVYGNASVFSIYTINVDGISMYQSD